MASPSSKTTGAGDVLDSASTVASMGDSIGRFRGVMGTSPPMNNVSPPPAADAGRSPDFDAALLSRPSGAATDANGEEDDSSEDNLLRIVRLATSAGHADDDDDDDAPKPTSSPALAASANPHPAATVDHATIAADHHAATNAPGRGSAPPTGGSFFGALGSFGAYPAAGGHTTSPGHRGQSPNPSAAGALVSPSASTTSNVWGGASLPGYPGAPAPTPASGVPHHQHGTPLGSGLAFNPAAAPFRSSAGTGGSPAAAGHFSLPPGGSASLLPPPPQYGTPLASGQPSADPTTVPGTGNAGASSSSTSACANVLVRNGNGVFLLTLVNSSPALTPPAAGMPSAAPGQPGHHATGKGTPQRHHHHHHQPPFAQQRSGSSRGVAPAATHGVPHQHHTHHHQHSSQPHHYGSSVPRSPIPPYSAGGNNGNDPAGGGGNNVGGSPLPATSTGHSPPPPMHMPPSMHELQRSMGGGTGASPKKDDPATRLPMGEPAFVRSGSRGGRGGGGSRGQEPTTGHPR